MQPAAPIEYDEYDYLFYQDTNDIGTDDGFDTEIAWKRQWFQQTSIVTYVIDKRVLKKSFILLKSLYL